MAASAPLDLRQDFYVPAATVWLGAAEQDLLHVHGLVVTQVEVDLQLSVAGQFKFTIPNTFDAGSGEFLTARGRPALDLLKLGQRVWIKMGYGGGTGQKLLLSGFITSVATGFSEGGSPDLEVSGQDALYWLTLGTREHRLENKDVRAAVAAVAAENLLQLRFSGTPPSNITLDSNLQSDLAFLTKLAENFSTPQEKWEFYARPSETVDQIHFRPRQIGAPPVRALKWGVDLLSFKPEANLGNQVGKVEVRGWDEVAKKEIVGVARPDSGGGSGAPQQAKTGAQIQKGFSGRETALQFRFPVKTREEADQRAAAELAKMVNDHVRGEGETFGLPDLLPDTRIALWGLGAKFSRTYYVTKTVHRYDSAGYRTRFSIEEQVS